MADVLTLAPAYGRDYHNELDALADWDAGFDFRITTPGFHTYCSIRDLQALKDSGITEIRICYAELAQTLIVQNI